MTGTLTARSGLDDLLWVQFHPCQHGALTTVTVRDYLAKGGDQRQLELIAEGVTEESPSLHSSECKLCQALDTMVRVRFYPCTHYSPLPITIREYLAKGGDQRQLELIAQGANWKLQFLHSSECGLCRILSHSPLAAVLVHLQLEDWLLRLHTPQPLGLIGQ